MTRPRRFLVRMAVFVAAVAALAALLFPPLRDAFLANAPLNGLIVGVLVLGILYNFRQVIMLGPEVAWIESFRSNRIGAVSGTPPKLLAPMATMLGERKDRLSLSTMAMRSLLDGIASRLDESRDLSRYTIGLLIFLGLLGTFWGLLQTVGSIGDVIRGLSVESGDLANVFTDLKRGLEAPLAGMGTAFSSSLFGLAGSLVLGFLDLQAGQAQGRFYVDLEDWLSTVTDLSPDELEGGMMARIETADDLRMAIDRLARSLHEVRGEGGGRAQTHAMANLAEGIQGLVQHVRSEQKMMREWAETQTRQQARVAKLLEQLSGASDRPEAGNDADRPNP